MRIQRFVLGASLAFWVACLAAQPYPSRQVRIIQPLGVGSPGDLISRAIAQSLSQTLGQAFVVENKVGANGIIGMEACAKAPPDGYTLCIPSFSQVTMNPVLYAKLPYEPLKDLAPVINIGVINSAVVVNASALKQFDSSALAVLLDCRRFAVSLGLSFAVSGMPPRLRQLAGLYGLAELVPAAPEAASVSAPEAAPAVP